MRRLILCTSSRVYIPKCTPEAVLPAACSRLMHNHAPAQSGMHGPGGQPSGAPALNKSLKDQPSRDDAPSKGGNNVVSDKPPSQGTDATSGTSTSPAKGGAKPAAGEATRRTFSSFRSFGSSPMQSQTKLHTQQHKARSFVTSS